MSQRRGCRGRGYKDPHSFINQRQFDQKSNRSYGSHRRSNSRVQPYPRMTEYRHVNDLPRPPTLQEIESMLAGAPIPGLLPMDQLIEPIDEKAKYNILKHHAMLSAQIHGLWMNNQKMQIEICNIHRRNRDLGMGGPLPYKGSEHGQLLYRLKQQEESNVA